MKALTLTQPWATLVAIGAKKIETRSWSTKYRGPLAIHAAKKFSKAERLICFEEPFYKHLRINPLALAWQTVPDVLPLGCVLATCELINVIRIGALSVWVDPNREAPALKLQLDCDYVEIPPDEPEFSFGDYTPMRYAWILAKVQTLPEPVPAKGALGLWEWEA